MTKITWAGSLVGRARLLHRRGREFESLPVHSFDKLRVDSEQRRICPLRLAEIKIVCLSNSLFEANPLVREGLPEIAE